MAVAVTHFDKRIRVGSGFGLEKVGEKMESIEMEKRRLFRQIKALKPPKNAPVRVCTRKTCRWRPPAGGRCVLPACFGARECHKRAGDSQNCQTARNTPKNARTAKG